MRMYGFMAKFGCGKSNYSRGLCGECSRWIPYTDASPHGECDRKRAMLHPPVCRADQLCNELIS